MIERLATQGIALGAMHEADLRAAIHQPLRWFQRHFPQIGHKTFEPALLTQLITDTQQFNHARDNRDAYLPLLQVTLKDLWNRGSLMRGAYTSLTHGVQAQAHNVYEYTVDEQGNRVERTPDQQAMMLSLLLDLVHVSLDDDAHRDVRQRRPLASLARTPEHYQLVRELAAARLVSTSVEMRDGQAVPVVDIIHESLLRNWHDLATAIEAQRTVLQRRQRFEYALAEWLENKSDTQYRLTGVRLAEAEELARMDNPATLTHEARMLLAQSRTALEQEHAEKLRWTRHFLLVAVVLLLVALFMAGFAVNRQQAALEQRNIAENNAQKLQEQLSISESQRLANDARNQPEHKTETGLLVAYEALARNDNTTSNTTLREFSHRMPWDVTLLSGHAQRVTSAVFSPDGTQILTASDDGTARLWRSDGTTRTTRTIYTATAITSAVFNPHGTQILAAFADGTARLWRSDGTLLTTLTGHSGAITSAVFSPDGTQILTASYDGTARLCRSDGTLITILTGHTDDVYSAVFSPDNSQILTASWDDTARLWRSDGTLITILIGHNAPVTHAMFSPDGTQILTASWDGDTRLWRSDGTLITAFTNIIGAVFSSDGTQILTASYDGTARLWHNDGTLITTLTGHTDVVNSAVFSLFTLS